MKITISKYYERWDLLAYDILGDASKAPEIMALNRTKVTLSGDIAEGTEIVLPDVYQQQINTTISIKAPWKL